MSGLQLEEGGEAESGSGTRLEESEDSEHSSALPEHSSALPSPAMTFSSGPVSLFSKRVSNFEAT